MGILDVFGSLLGRFIAFTEIDEEHIRKQTTQPKGVKTNTSEAFENQAEVSDDVFENEMFDEF